PGPFARDGLPVVNRAKPTASIPSGCRIVSGQGLREESMSGERWRVYIDNLADEADADDLVRLAFTWGNVLGGEIVRDASTGRIKGFGWVAMTCKSEAHAAAEGLSGWEFRGRRLTARFLTPPEISRRPYCPTRFRADWAPSGSDPGGSEKGFGRAELEDLCR